MPIQLRDFADYVKLPGLAHGLSWICVSCKTVNRPSNTSCCECDKMRWDQLGISAADVLDLAKRIE